MKRLNLTLLTILLGSSMAFAAGLLSKQTAEADALKAVGGGTVIQATLETERTRKIWSIDITGSTHEYEVWVDARNGSIMKIFSQPLSEAGRFITRAEAESEAQDAVGGGEVLQSVMDARGTNDRTVWSVDLADSTKEHEVQVDAQTGTVLKITSLPLQSMAPCTFLSKAKAEAIALRAVNGGTVTAAFLDKTDRPVNWSVDITHRDGQDYEVKVNACTGKVLQIIIGG